MMNQNINSKKFLDLIKLLLLLQKITKDESLRKNIDRLIIKCDGKCGNLAERRTRNQGKGKGTKRYYVVNPVALEEFNSDSKNKSNSKLKIEINEMLKNFYKEYIKSIPENEIPQINSPNQNAKSNANTVAGPSNQSNLTEELNNLNKKNTALLQNAVTSGGSRKKSKKSRS